MQKRYWSFAYDFAILQSMSDVSKSITALQPKSQLYVIRGSPMEILPLFFKACKITHLFFEKDDDEYTRVRDNEVERMATEAGVKVVRKHGHTMYEAEVLIKRNKGKTPMTYAQFQKLADTMGEPPRPLERPTSLPPPGKLDLKKALKDAKPTVDAFRKRDKNAEHRDEAKEDKDLYKSIAGPDGKFAVPTMEELAMKPATSSIRGGETRALEVLENWLTERKQEAIVFEKPKTSPAGFDPVESECSKTPYELWNGTLTVMLSPLQQRFYRRI